MRGLILLVCVAALGSGSYLAGQEEPAAGESAAAGTERGVFQIKVGGRTIGSERFEIVPTAEGLRARGELQISQEGVGKLTETATLVLRADLQPAHYERIQKAPKRGSAVLTFATEKATAMYRTTQGGTQEMEFHLPANVVVLDTNFFHHYTILVRRYDFVRGGAQHFGVLVPQEASPGMIRVEFGGADQGLRKLVAHTDEVEIHIWANDAGQIQKLSVPDASVEVVRERQ
jgi:hypothetical protein